MNRNRMYIISIKDVREDGVTEYLSGMSDGVFQWSQDMEMSRLARHPDCVAALGAYINAKGEEKKHYRVDTYSYQNTFDGATCTGRKSIYED